MGIVGSCEPVCSLQFAVLQFIELLLYLDLIPIICSWSFEISLLGDCVAIIP